MTALRYEDTVQLEVAPCVDCGVLVDELFAEFWGDDRLCTDCGEERREKAQ